ncbi:hypothetical protein AA984_06625 [Brevibacillus formosus]|uniref:Uncharacterized protein n=1 Tax=Brevibacillus formosus TaxID=54913 RepID=A0A837KRX8_9BACL|nr:hypothetical protein AA984_06625 [Brevibacillus formosus]MBG9946138.1 hypothetical protein [Brevibacillus formosus]PSJ95858.1 hypothetical protein C7R91_14190 [Brevibacillus formosus]
MSTFIYAILFGEEESLLFHYTYNQEEIEINEHISQQDATYHIVVKSESMRARVKEVRRYFEGNKDYTDVLFFSREDGSFEVIVRHNMIESFLIHAFRFKCLKSICWE